ncbi:type II secretion system protein GspK [Geminicoccus flavidas]|uniref:type II secretion system protein GspK n=1 Tax=Geminicoccus flavidas TaxID=2506407 RepID=UPI001356CB03|nr:type II secretion system protein GspK [Geminicoccus flavidas]
MTRDRRGSAVLVVIWMTGVLAVMALGFSGRVREGSLEVNMAEARLRASAAIDGEFAQMLYNQLRSSREIEDRERAEAARRDAEAEAEAEAQADAETNAALADSDDGLDSGFDTGGDTMDSGETERSLSDASGEPAVEPSNGIEAMMLSGRAMTSRVVADGVSLYLHAEPEMGRIDVNRGDPRVLRALLEKIADRQVATRAIEVTEAGKKRASRAGAVIGSAPRPFVSVDAWLAATGMDASIAERVRPYLTTATGAPNVELKFARQELIDVLPFLSRSQKQMIAEARAKSPAELSKVLAQIAEDPSTAPEPGEEDGEEGDATGPARQVMRLTVEATIDGLLRRTDRFLLAFEDGQDGGDAGAGESGQTGETGDAPLAVTAAGAEAAAAQSAQRLPFVVLDRQTLDAPPPPPPAPGQDGVRS